MESIEEYRDRLLRERLGVDRRADGDVKVSPPGCVSQDGRPLASERRSLPSETGAGRGNPPTTGLTGNPECPQDATLKIGVVTKQVTVSTAPSNRRGRPKGMSDFALWSRRIEVATLDQQKLSVYEIAEKKGMTLAQIYGDLAYIRKWAWRDFTDNMRAIKCSQVDELHRGRKKLWKIAEVNTDDGTKIKAVAEINQSVMAEAKLTGTLAPDKHELTGARGGPIKIIEIQPAPIVTDITKVTPFCQVIEDDA